MGWWSIGNDEIMGDEPADILGMALAELAATAARRNVRNPTVDEIIDAVVAALRSAPKLLAKPRVMAATAGEQLREVLLARLTADGLAVVVGEGPLAREVTGVVWNALHKISQAYRDTERGRAPSLREMIDVFTFVLGVQANRYLALGEPLMRWPRYHPLLGVPPATAADLVGRCDAEARSVLALASQIARLRCEALPLGPFDLLRALQARGALAPLFRGPSLPRLDVEGAALRAMVTAFTAASEATPLELEAAWTPRVTALLASRAGTLGPAELLAGLSPAALVELCQYDQYFAEGLFTEDEAVARFEEGQSERSGCPAPPRWGVHLDRCGELESLTELLRLAAEVVIVTDTLPLAASLIQAWAVKIGAPAFVPPRPAPSAFCADLPERWGAPRDQRAQLFTLPGQLCALFHVDPEDLRSRLQSPPDGDLRNIRNVRIIAATAEALGAAITRLPALAELPRLELARLREGELLAAWLSQRVRVALTTGESFSLHTLIDAIEAADEDDRWTLEWEQLRPWLAVPSRKARKSLLWYHLRRLLGGKMGKFELDSLAEHRIFARFIQSEERLRYLIELDKTLP